MCLVLQSRSYKTVCSCIEKEMWNKAGKYWSTQLHYFGCCWKFGFLSKAVWKMYVLWGCPAIQEESNNYFAHICTFKLGERFLHFDAFVQVQLMCIVAIKISLCFLIHFPNCSRKISSQNMHREICTLGKTQTKTLVKPMSQMHCIKENCLSNSIWKWYMKTI